MLYYSAHYYRFDTDIRFSVRNASDRHANDKSIKAVSGARHEFYVLGRFVTKMSEWKF